MGINFDWLTRLFGQINEPQAKTGTYFKPVDRDGIPVPELPTGTMQVAVHRDGTPVKQIQPHRPEEVELTEDEFYAIQVPIHRYG